MRADRGPARKRIVGNPGLERKHLRDACPLRRVESIDGEAVLAGRVVPKHLHVRIPFQRERSTQLVGRPVLDRVNVTLPRLWIGQTDPLGSRQRRQFIKRFRQCTFQLMLDVRIPAERLNLAKDCLQILQSLSIKTLPREFASVLRVAIFLSIKRR